MAWSCRCHYITGESDMDVIGAAIDAFILVYHKKILLF